MKTKENKRKMGTRFQRPFYVSDSMAQPSNENRNAAIGVGITSSLKLASNPMKLQFIICYFAIALISCGQLLTVAERPAKSQQEAFADLMPTDSKHFSATERKAVKAAKTHLEVQRKRAIDARYKVNRISTGHEVIVMFVGGYDSNQKPLYLPGGHCTVQLSEDFRVVHVSAGE